jgi:hypothetical protein
MSTNTIGHRVNPAINTGLTATGSSQATAFPLTSNTLHEFISVPSSSGAVLPTKMPSQVTVFNNDTNALAVYPPLGGAINGGSVNASASVAPQTGSTYWASSPTSWYSLQTAASGSGSGTVTSVASGTGLTGGPVTTTGTLSLATIGDKSVLANTSGGTAAPAGVTLSALIDEAIAGVQGDVLYRGSAAWSALPPGTSGQFLQTQGAAANPQWASAAGTGTVNTGTTGQVAYYATSTAAVSGESLSSLIDAAIDSTQGDILYRGASTWAALPAGTAGQFLQSGGAAANPSWTTSSLATIPTLNILANTTGGTAAPAGVLLTALLDADFSSTRGVIPFRGASVWGPIATGTAQNPLQTGGAGADPSWNANSLLPSAGPVRKLGGLIFSCGACTAVASTAAATSVFGSPANSFGTLTIPANTLAVGQVLRWTLWATYGSTASTPTVAFNYLLGATTVLTSSAVGTLTAAATNHMAYSTAQSMLFITTAGSGGAVGGSAQMNFLNTGTIASASIPTGGLATVSVATNASLLFDIQLTWGTSSATNTFQVLAFELFLDG